MTEVKSSIPVERSFPPKKPTFMIRCRSVLRTALLWQRCGCQRKKARWAIPPKPRWSVWARRMDYDEGDTRPALDAADGNPL
jgi:hypothetical protein